MDDTLHITITLILLFCINMYGFVYSYFITTSTIFAKYKIQNKDISFDVLKSRIPIVLFNVIILMILTTIGLFYFKSYYITNYSSIYIELGKLICVLLVDDIFFYFLHRTMHENKYIYKTIHKIHHRANTPIPIDYIYVHPLEWLSGFIGPFIGMLLLNGISIYTFWLYLIIRNMHELHIHSGLKTSFISKIIPFYGPNEHHDLHHAKRDGNYASTFVLWDKIFKTQF